MTDACGIVSYFLLSTPFNDLNIETRRLMMFFKSVFIE